MMTSTTQSGETRLGKWASLLLWAVLAAVLIELCSNMLLRRTIWNRMDEVENQLHHIERQIGTEPGKN